MLLYRVERNVIDLGSLRGAWDAVRRWTLAEIKPRSNRNSAPRRKPPRPRRLQDGASTSAIRSCWMN